VVTAVFGPWAMLAFPFYLALGTWLFGQTVGKWLLRVQVRRLSGARLDPLRALARSIVVLWYPIAVALLLWLSGSKPSSDKEWMVANLPKFSQMLLLYVFTFVFAAFHPRKRAIHDLLVGTVAVYKLQRGGPAR
jgi:uncharacterized RDD family membrane protein YckC